MLPWRVQAAFDIFREGGGKIMSVRGEILGANKAFMEAFGRADSAELASLYTKNGKLLPPNSDFVSGMESIRVFWQGALDMGIKGAKLETVEVEGQENGAYEVGNYVLSGAQGEVMDRGKYVVIWKNQRGKWKLHRDIWNSSLPAPSK
jgi:ketosteroid isomerase-like protein